MLCRSGCSCAAASTCPFTSPCAPADANLTCLATSDLPGGWGPCLHNLHVRDKDLAAFNNLDGRRLEVVADGLTLWQGAQLAIDTTLVSPLCRDGSARPRVADHDEAALTMLVIAKSARTPNCLGTGEGLACGPCRGGWGQVER